MIRRTRKWTSQDTRRILVDAAWETMLTTISEDGTYDLNISEVLRRAEVAWAFEHSDNREFTRGSIMSLWPGGVEEFRRHVIVQRYLGSLEDDDQVLSSFASRIRQAQRGGSQRETRQHDLKVAVASFARDLLVDRMNRPLALLFFRTLLERSDSTARLELDAGLSRARERALPFFGRVTKSLNWRKTTPEALHAAITSLVDGFLLQWAVQRTDDSVSPVKPVYDAAFALCEGFVQTERHGATLRSRTPSGNRMAGKRSHTASQKARGMTSPDAKSTGHSATRR